MWYPCLSNTFTTIGKLTKVSLLRGVFLRGKLCIEWKSRLSNCNLCYIAFTDDILQNPLSCYTIERRSPIIAFVFEQDTWPRWIHRRARTVNDPSLAAAKRCAYVMLFITTNLVCTSVLICLMLHPPPPGWVMFIVVCTVIIRTIENAEDN